MGKNTDAVKSIDEFKAPWETEGGEDAEIDKPKLRRWIHNLLKDKAKAQDSRDEALENLKTAEAERDEAKTLAEKANPDEVNKKISKLEADNAKLKDENKSLTDAADLSTLRADVLGNLDPKYAKYVVGTTQEELEKSLEAVKADFNLGDDEEVEEEETTGRVRPVTRLRNSADPETGKTGDAAVNPDKLADELFGGGAFR